MCSIHFRLCGGQGRLMEFKAGVGSEDFRKKNWQQDVYKVQIAYQSGDEI